MKSETLLQDVCLGHATVVVIFFRGFRIGKIIEILHRDYAPNAKKTLKLMKGNSLGSKRNYKKNLGVCGTKRGNLHTGSVFGAEQDQDGYRSKF